MCDIDSTVYIYLSYLALVVTIDNMFILYAVCLFVFVRMDAGDT